MAYNTAAYAGDVAGPGQLQDHVADIQASGLTTVILFALHVGRKMTEYPTMQVGDLIYNHFPQNLIVRGGKFKPNNSPAIAAWPAQVARLKQQGSVTKVFVALGGACPPIYDFTTIQNMFNTGQAGTLKDNIVALKNAFTVNGVCAIDGFDFDCEEPDIDLQTFLVFSRLLFGLGFEVTFCPFASISDWQDRMQALWDQGMKVSWWNLQCYSGGSDNPGRLPEWIEALAKVVGKQAAPSYLVPGIAAAGADDAYPDLCPTGQDSVWSTFRGWNNPRLAGGFLWTYDALAAKPTLCGGQNNLAAYVKAINGALGGKSP